MELKYKVIFVRHQLYSTEIEIIFLRENSIELKNVIKTSNDQVFQEEFTAQFK